jgi:hypothetical protein
VPTSVILPEGRETSSSSSSEEVGVVEYEDESEEEEEEDGVERSTRGRSGFQMKIYQLAPVLVMFPRILSISASDPQRL